MAYKAYVRASNKTVVVKKPSCKVLGEYIGTCIDMKIYVLPVTVSFEKV